MGFFDRFPAPPPWLMSVLRVVQFVDAAISLVLYGIYVAHLLAGSGSPQHAVLGIAGAAVVWAVTAFLQHTWAHREDLKSSEAKKGMLKKGGIVAAAAATFIAIDLIFLILSVASAGITGSELGSCGAGGGRDNGKRSDNNNSSSSPSNYCALLKGTLALNVINMCVCPAPLFPLLRVPLAR